jgi:hypothetical protein
VSVEEVEGVHRPYGHECGVCFRDADRHLEHCYEEALHPGQEMPVTHWPAPCHRGCGCLSWEMAHAPDVRAITVKQPWATAIALGYKLVENRSAGTRWRGPLLIHAGRAWSDRGAIDERIRDVWKQERLPLGIARDRDWEDGFGRWVYDAASRRRSQVPVMAVVAVAQLVDSHPDAGCCRPWGESEYRESGGKVRRQVHHLVLERVERLPTPLWARGQLGLWRPRTELVAEVIQAGFLLPTPDPIA